MTGTKIIESNEALHKDLLTILAQFKETPVGAVIYDQISKIVTEQETAQRNLAQVYSMLLRVLMDGYIKNPTQEYASQINAKLSELRANMDRATAAQESDQVEETSSAPVFDASSDQHIPENLSDHETNLSDEPESSDVLDVLDEIAENPEPVSSELEAATNENLSDLSHADPAYQLHIDRRHDEVNQLQEAFGRNVQAAIDQNREFGALLQIELGALQQAEDGKEIKMLRQILIGAIEELIQSQRSLDVKLHRTSGYMQLIRADSERLRDELGKARLQSLTDEFTSIPNRRAFMQRLQDEIGRAQRYGTPLALAMLDLDNFKAINDVHGHTAGDEVLRSYATNVLSVLRHHDLVARYGGEEFAVLLPNTVIEGARAALHKVRTRGQAVVCKFRGKTLPIPTFSAGLTMYEPGDEGSALIDRADRALYRAKRLGRDRVEIEPTGSSYRAEHTSEIAS